MAKPILKHHVHKVISDKRGTGDIISSLVASLLLLMVFVVILSAMAYTVQLGNLLYATRRVVRSIEITGKVDEQTTTLMQELTNDSTQPTMTISATYFNTAKKTIQLRDTFSVTISGTYSITILTAPFGNSPPVMLHVPMSITVKGMSEVYQKNGT